MASNLGSADTTAPYLIAWNSALASNGSHTILAEARDAANNVSTTSVVVNVSNGGGPSSPFYVDFDGSDDYARVADADALSFGNGAADAPFTIETWIRPDSWPGKQQLVGKWGESAEPGLRVQAVCRVDGASRFDMRDHSANALVSVYTGNQSALAGALASRGGDLRRPRRGDRGERRHHLRRWRAGGGDAGQQCRLRGDGEHRRRRCSSGARAAASSMYNGGLDDLRLWNVARARLARSRRR